ncbi:MAG: hypothetical protein R3B90_14860 [Planctomycetaceae bacterium]
MPAKSSNPQGAIVTKILQVLGIKGSIAVFVLLLAYLLLRPWLQDRLGVELPGLFAEAAPTAAANPAPESSSPTKGRVASADSPNASPDSRVATTTPSRPQPTRNEPAQSTRSTSQREPDQNSTTNAGSSATSTDSRTTTTPPKPTPSTQPSSPVGTPSTSKPSSSTTPDTPTSTTTPASTTKPSTPPRTTPPKAEPKLGELTEIGRGDLRSTAGLIYRKLRSEHRVEHVMRHSEDDQSRPIHGVFDGDREEILALIDEAWMMAQQRGPPAVRKEQQDDRTVYMIDLGRKIGYIGGQSGKRQRNPACRHLQLVVEDNEVITAYPKRP